jgi:hypothetical protein
MLTTKGGKVESYYYGNNQGEGGGYGIARHVQASNRSTQRPSVGSTMLSQNKFLRK